MRPDPSFVIPEGNLRFPTHAINAVISTEAERSGETCSSLQGAALPHTCRLDRRPQAAVERPLYCSQNAQARHVVTNMSSRPKRSKSVQRRDLQFFAGCHPEPKLCHPERSRGPRGCSPSTTGSTFRPPHPTRITAAPTPATASHTPSARTARQPAPTRTATAFQPSPSPASA